MQSHANVIFLILLKFCSIKFRFTLKKIFTCLKENDRLIDSVIKEREKSFRQ